MMVKQSCGGVTGGKWEELFQVPLVEVPFIISTDNVTLLENSRSLIKNRRPLYKINQKRSHLRLSKDISARNIQPEAKYCVIKKSDNTTSIFTFEVCDNV